MTIVGLQKLTLLDYPGKVACTVFLGGCNFHCPFCHNSQLLTADCPQLMEEAELLAFLRSRAGILEGVCITGGEPTLQPDLPQLLRGIRELGYQIKLDTNGYRPQVLKELVAEGLVDYVAMDIKNGPAQYGMTVGLEQPDLARIEESIRFLLEGKVAYEFRTTVAEPLHSEASVTDMCGWLQTLGQGKKAQKWYLQPFVDRETVPVAGLAAPEREMLDRFLAKIALCAEEFGLRGV